MMRVQLWLRRLILSYQRLQSDAEGLAPQRLRRDRATTSTEPSGTDSEAPDPRHSDRGTDGTTGDGDKEGTSTVQGAKNGRPHADSPRTAPSAQDSMHAEIELDVGSSQDYGPPNDAVVQERPPSD